MNRETQKMPKRLWIVAGGLIIVALLGLVLSTYLFFFAGNVLELEISASRYVYSLFFPLFLLGTSIALLMRKPKANKYVISAATIYFGALIYQNAALLMSGVVPDELVRKPAATIVRSSLWLIAIYYTMNSAKLKTYLQGGDSVDLDEGAT